MKKKTARPKKKVQLEEKVKGKQSLLKRFWWLGIVIITGIVFLSPFLRYPAFNVIDDGASLRVSRDLLADISHGFGQWPNLLIEKQDGRFRPLYLLSFFFVYAVFGAQPFAFWFVQAFLLSGTLFLMGLFLYVVTKNRWISVLSPLSVLLFSSTADNFYRLGTAEPKQMLAWLLFVLWCWWWREKGLTVKVFFAGLAVLWTGLLTKETSISFVAVFWALWVWQILFAKKRSLADAALGLTLGLLSSSFIFLLPTKSGYNSGFHFDVHSMMRRFLFSRGENAVLYLSLFLAWFSGIVRFVWEWWSTKKFPDEKKYVWQWFFALQAILLLVVGILPWQYMLTRYFYPLYLVGALGVGIEVAAWRELWPVLKKLKMVYQFGIATGFVLVATVFQRFLLGSAAHLSLNVRGMWFRLLVDRLDGAEIWLLLLIAIGAELLRLVLYWWRKEKFYLTPFLWDAWFLLAIGVSVFLSSLIWSAQNAIVFIVPSLLTEIFVVRETLQWFAFVHKKNGAPVWYLGYLSFLVLIIPILHVVLFQGMSRPLRFVEAELVLMRTSFDAYQISYGAIRYLLADVHPHEHVYVIANDYEVIFEIGLYASNLRSRPIQLFTTDQQVVEDFSKEYSYLTYDATPAAHFVEDTKEKIMLLRKMDWPSVSATVSGKIQHLPPQATFHTYGEYAYWEVVK